MYGVRSTALTTSQIWWTARTNHAFERLEQGNESAMKEYAAQVVAPGSTS